MTNLKHDASSSKYLMKILIAVLLIFHSIIVTVGNSYYNRFIKLEIADDKFDTDIEVLKSDLKDAEETIDYLRAQINIVNQKLINGK